jgi:hypothetical protein
MDEQRGSGAQVVGGQPQATVGAGYGVSDEVWRALEPEARAAAARERGALLRTALVTGVLVLLGIGVLWSGAFSPRLSGGDNSGYDAGSPGARAHLQFDLHNDGVVTEHVTRWALPVPGVEVTGVSPDPLEVAPRSQQKVDLQIRVADCTRATGEARTWLATNPVDGPGLRVWSRRPWGSAAATVTPPGSMAEMVLMVCGVDLSKE